MAILHKLDDCDIVFQYGSINDQNGTLIPLFNYSTSLNEIKTIPDNKMTVIKENVPLKLFFSASKEYSLIIYGFDEVQGTNESSDGQYRYLPSEEPYEIIGSNTCSVMPGYYIVKIQYMDKIYYSYLKVEPSQLSMKDWELMIKDIDSFLHGLAEEFSGKKVSISRHENYEMIPGVLLNQFIIIKESERKIIAVLDDLSQKAKLKIKKTHVLVNKSFSSMKDAYSIRYMQQYGGRKNKKCMPQKNISFDLDENVFLKSILSKLKKRIDVIIESAEEYIDFLDSEITKREFFELQKHKSDPKTNLYKKGKEFIMEGVEKCCRIKDAILRFNELDWYKSIPLRQGSVLNVIQSMDYRYNYVYRLAKLLKTPEMRFGQSSEFALQIKETCVLYEIWTYLLIYKALITDGYKAVSGWIHDREWNSHKVLLPVLESGTVVTFIKDSITLKLTYDGAIPGGKSRTDEKNMPIFTNSVHNRPDIRLDIYNYEKYLGSILMDCKYRKFKNIWDDTLSDNAYGRQNHKVMQQLMAYGDQCRSIFLPKNVRPVQEVFAIYPKSTVYEQGELLDIYNDALNIRLLKVYPGQTNIIGDKILDIVYNCV